MKKNIILMMVVFAVSACASPKVIESKKADDFDLSCQELKAQMKESEEFRTKAEEEKGMTGTNIAAAVLFWPALLATYHNIDEAVDAAKDRKDHLMRIYEKKGCGGKN